MAIFGYSGSNRGCAKRGWGGQDYGETIKTHACARDRLASRDKVSEGRKTILSGLAHFSTLSPHFYLVPSATFQDAYDNGCGTTSGLPRLTRIPGAGNWSPVVRGKAAHLVDGFERDTNGNQEAATFHGNRHLPSAPLPREIAYEARFCRFSALGFEALWLVLAPP